MASETETRRLRYSERKRISETGSLGSYVADDVPGTLRNALHYLIYAPRSTPRTSMIEAVEAVARLHFGWHGKETTATFVGRASVDDLLDFLEIVVEKCLSGPHRGDYVSDPYRGRGYYESAHVMPDIERQINVLFERHRFGYRFADGEARLISSPALEVEIVGPALLAANRSGWDHVERSYREALTHQRGGETDDAITAAHAAVEAALKAVGFKGQFGTMLKQFRKSSLVPTYLRTAPEALDLFLKLLSTSNAVRSAEGDAHGKAPGASEAAQPLADLAIHWAGAFIVFLAASAPPVPQS
jgi:hypothetical protein